MNVPVIYIVRLWVDPQGEQQVLGWLEGGHLAEVVRQPGFQSVTRMRLEQRAEDGWIGHAMIYTLASREALETYFNDGQLTAKFGQERAPLAKYLRMERMWGAVESALNT